MGYIRYLALAYGRLLKLVVSNKFSSNRKHRIKYATCINYNATCTEKSKFSMKQPQLRIITVIKQPSPATYCSTLPQPDPSPTSVMSLQPSHPLPPNHAPPSSSKKTASTLHPHKSIRTAPMPNSRLIRQWTSSTLQHHTPIISRTRCYVLKPASMCFAKNRLQ